MKKILDFLLYSGISKESFMKIRDRVSEENKHSVSLYSLFTAVVFLVVMLITIISKKYASPVPYIIASSLFLVMWILNYFLTNKWPKISDVFSILFASMFLVIGAYIGISQSTERTTLLLAFFVFASLTFSFRIIYIIIIVLGTELVYLISIRFTQTGELLTVNSINTIIFSLAGLYIGIKMMVMKFKKHENEYEKEFLLRRDALTSVLNRFSFEEELTNIKINKKPVTICAFDINGLKECNDTHGHNAGDELLIGTAKCIKEVFGKYGKVFRTGGDEFVAILRNDNYDKEELLKEFKEKTKSWHGELAKDLDVSTGISSINQDYETLLQNALLEADKLMYEEKKKYYENKGITITGK